MEANSSMTGSLPEGPKPRTTWSLSFIGVLIYVFTVYTYRLPVADVGIGLAVLGLLFERPKIRVPKYLKWFGAFAIWCIASLGWSEFPQLTQDNAIYVVKLWIIALVITNALRDEPRIRAFCLFTLLCYITHAGRGSIQNFVTGNTYRGRAVWNGEFENPNFLAGIAILLLSVAIGLLFSARGRLERWFLFACIGLTPVVILATQSRSNFIGLIFLAGVGLYSAKGTRKVKIAVGTFGLAIAAAVVAPKGVWDRVSGLRKVNSSEGMAGVDPEGSAAERFRILRTGWQIFNAAPIAGMGATTYPYMNQVFAPELGKKDAHNTYMSVLAETGVVGLVLFLGMIMASLRRDPRAPPMGRKSGSEELLTWLRAGLIAFMVSAIWGTVTFLQFLYLHLALIGAVAALVLRNRRLAAYALPAQEGTQPAVVPHLTPQ